MVEWNVEDSIRQELITILIDKLPFDTVTQWVHNTMDSMNKEGFYKWKGFAIEMAISKKKINVRNMESSLEDALSLGKDRAKIALQLLLISGFNKIEMKKFREKIIDLQNDYPEYVKQFGFKFKLKKDIVS